MNRLRNLLRLFDIANVDANTRQILINKSLLQAVPNLCPEILDIQIHSSEQFKGQPHNICGYLYIDGPPTLHVVSEETRF